MALTNAFEPRIQSQPGIFPSSSASKKPTKQEECLPANCVPIPIEQQHPKLHYLHRGSVDFALTDQGHGRRKCVNHSVHREWIAVVVPIGMPPGLDRMPKRLGLLDLHLQPFDSSSVATNPGLWHGHPSQECEAKWNLCLYIIVGAVAIKFCWSRLTV